ncbi:TPA: glycosyltransferase [Photobacterium damselae]
MVKITVVTVCYNAESVISKTIESVKNQNYDNLEYIIIDGLSSDKTLEKVNDYDVEIIVSERDHGIYDAMNKGIQQSTGDWLIFMNAGDVFASSDVITHIVDCIHENKNVNLIYGNYIIANVEKYQKLSLTFLMSHMLNHQSVFYHSSIIKNKKYNLKYKFCADYAHLIGSLCEINPMYINKAVCIYDDEGISSQDKNKYKMWLERLDAIWFSDLNTSKKIYLSLRGFISLPYQYIKAKVLY